MNEARFAYARDSYAVLGLRGNPFVAEDEPGVVPALWIERAGVPDPPRPNERRLVQLIGPKGAGKTSLLLQWRHRAPGPYHYVPPRGAVRFQRPPIAPLAYWDEVDRMGEPVRTAAFAYAAVRGTTIVAGTHADLTRLARACGLSVSTYTFSDLDPATLRRWAAYRIAEAARPGVTPTLELDAPTAQVICDRVGPSLRDAGVLLHIWAAERARAAL